MRDRDRLWVPSREGIQRYTPQDLERYQRYRRKWLPRIAFVQAAQNGNAATSTANIAATVSTVGTANMVAGIVTWGSATTTELSSITDNGTGPGTWVIQRRIPDAGNGQCGASFFGWGWSVGPTVITANFSPNQVYRGISVIEFSGQATGNPLDGTNENGQIIASPGLAADGAFANGATYAAGKITPGGDNYIVWGGGLNTGNLNLGSTSEFTAGTSFTEPANAEHQVFNDISLSSEYWLQTTATAVNASWTVTQNTAHMTFMMIFKVAGGTPSDQMEWLTRHPPMRGPRWHNTGY